MDFKKLSDFKPKHISASVHLKKGKEDTDLKLPVPPPPPEPPKPSLSSSKKEIDNKQEENSGV
ncbi:MAG: hypothetical protein ABRQ38_20715 [Candidatus Eremiobacterota bacterium]